MAGGSAGAQSLTAAKVHSTAPLAKPAASGGACLTKGIGHMLVCLCCGEDRQPAGPGNRSALPFCSRCLSETCRRCRRWVRLKKWERDPTFNLMGRPRGPRMACGWGCGAELTGHKMRGHFTICPKRLSIPDQVDQFSPLVPAGLGLTVRCGPVAPRFGNAKIKRGRPAGPRMPCGWRCGAKLTASELRKHFTKCPKRPKD